MENQDIRKLGYRDIRYFFNEKAKVNQEINSIIIEDEISGMKNLENILTDYCIGIKVIGRAFTVKEAITEIERKKPDLIFLDIQLRDGLGFQILENLDNIPFEIIFITAFNKYAIKAFEFSSVGYLLKPVDPELLVKSVNRVKLNLSTKSSDARYFLLKENLKNNFKSIALKTNTGIVFIDLTDIIFIDEDEELLNFYLFKDRIIKVYGSLKNFEDLLYPTFRTSQ